jgi:tetratricopeptide (TPR) repeat protein
MAGNAITAAPEWAPAWICAGRRAMYKKDLLKADNYCAQALRLEPGNEEAKELLNQVRTAIAKDPQKNAKEIVRLSDSYAAANDFKRANEYADKAIALAPDWVPAWFCAGRRAMAAKDFIKAERCFTQARMLEPANDEAKRLLEQVKQILTMAPQRKASEMMKLASAHAASNDLKKASEFAEKAIALTPEWVPAWVFAGRQAMTAMDFDKAGKYLVQALILEPGNAEAKDLLDQLRKILAVTPQKNVAEMMKLSDTYASSNDFKKASEFAEKAISLAPEWAPAWICAGRRAMDSKDFNKAEKCFAYALTLDPGNTEAKALMEQLKKNTAKKLKQ